MASLIELPVLPSLSFNVPSVGQINSKIYDIAKDVKDTAEKPGKELVRSTFFSSSNISIMLGLLLIAAGLFTFDKTKELVVSTAKKGAALATAA